MTKTIRCDICGKNNIFVYTSIHQSLQLMGTLGDMDLCIDCSDKLSVYVKSLKDGKID